MSLPKPTACTPCGSYKCAVPMALDGRVHSIDYCVADLVAALNAGGVKTAACCCGHGEQPGVVALEDGRKLTITTPCNKGESK